MAAKEERRNVFCLVTETAAHQSLQGRRTVALSPLLMSDLMSLGKLLHAQQNPCPSLSLSLSLSLSFFFFVHKSHFLRSVTHSSIQLVSAGRRTCRPNSEMNVMWLLMSSVCFLSVGLTWEDDTTQQVLAKELSKLRRIPYRPQQNGPVYAGDSRSDDYRSASLCRCVFPGDVPHKLF